MEAYTDLCGPIDEEIFTPELVREGAFVPMRTKFILTGLRKEELKEIGKYQEQTAGVYRELLTGPEFTRMIATHKGLQDPEGYSEKFLEEPKYFSALLIFCQAQGIPFPPYLRRLIGDRGKTAGTDG